MNLCSRCIAAAVGGACAIAATAACSAQAGAAFWFEADALTLTRGTSARLGGPITPGEAAVLQAISREEIARAFEGLRIELRPRGQGAWSVAVRRSIRAGRSRQLPAAGESLALGPLGGSGAVGVDVVAAEALRYAPENAPRGVVLEGIGRGIGRVAVHEFVHQMLGPAIGHNDADADSYEHGSPARRSLYYGRLHWTTARPLLERRFAQRGPAPRHRD